MIFSSRSQDEFFWNTLRNTPSSKNAKEKKELWWEEIGLTLRGPIVIKVNPDSEAAKKGIQAGWCIIEIDGHRGDRTEASEQPAHTSYTLSRGLSYCDVISLSPSLSLPTNAGGRKQTATPFIVPLNRIPSVTSMMGGTRPAFLAPQ